MLLNNGRLLGKCVHLSISTATVLHCICSFGCALLQKAWMGIGVPDMCTSRTGLSFSVSLRSLSVCLSKADRFAAQLPERYTSQIAGRSESDCPLPWAHPLVGMTYDDTSKLTFILALEIKANEVNVVGFCGLLLGTGRYLLGSNRPPRFPRFHDVPCTSALFVFTCSALHSPLSF